MAVAINWLFGNPSMRVHSHADGSIPVADFGDSQRRSHAFLVAAITLPSPTAVAIHAYRSRPGLVGRSTPGSVRVLAAALNALR